MARMESAFLHDVKKRIIYMPAGPLTLEILASAAGRVDPLLT